MASYSAPRKDILFTLHDVLDAGRLGQLPGYEDVSAELIDGIVDEAARFIEQVLAPLSRSSDDEGCRWENGQVHLPAGYTEAYRQFQEAGWVGLANPTEFGGQGLPFLLGKVVGEMVSSANVAFELYVGLTQDCFEAILAKGSDELRQIYCAKLGSGEWTGTMCLTEPQAGSDLAAVKTRATPNGDGSYALAGTKIFITSGEHDMVGNIVHFVLARLPDAPAGVKGLSTFVVPKFLPDASGGPGERNAVHCISIEHKMGMHGSCTCTMQFDGARGFLVGEPNQGIQNMFVMMNLARIMVGYQGLGLCELATQQARAYALERRQGRTFGGEETIIGHPDVRRMLLDMKALTEAGRAMAYDTALHVDLSRRATDAAEREAAQDFVELMTPVVKACLTENAFQLGSTAVQVYGGHGYIRESGVEQIIRDAKILALYEGTNGIQAMDLLRRKLTLHGGRLPAAFFARVRAELDAPGHAEVLASSLRDALDVLESTTHWAQQSFAERPLDAAFGCVDYLRAFSLVTLGYYWLRIARAAEAHADAGFAAAKLATAQHFAARHLPLVAPLCAIVRSPVDAQMAVPADAL